MAFESPSRILPANHPVARTGLRRSNLACGPPPVELIAPSALSMWGIDFPDSPSPRRAPVVTEVAVVSRRFRVSPRRGFPHPLRSAFAVSDDLDGLLPPTSCDLFQPLTPVGFVSRGPVRLLRSVRIEDRGPCDGASRQAPGRSLSSSRPSLGLISEEMRPGSVSPRFPRPPLRPPRWLVRFRLPSCVATSYVRHRRITRSASSSRSGLHRVMTPRVGGPTSEHHRTSEEDWRCYATGAPLQGVPLS